MRILLTTLNARFSHSSLALRYLRSYCRPVFPELDLVEFTINDHLDSVFGEIYRYRARVVGFSCYIWNIAQTLEICGKLKKVAPETIIVLGGPEVSFDPAEIINAHPYVDYVVMGEGEETFKELLISLEVRANQSIIPESNPSKFNILGLAYRAEGQAVVNPARPLMRNLDQIPPAYGLPEVPPAELSELKNRVVYYESSRGCPFECQYCLSSTQPGVRYFSLERVKAELLALIRAGVEHIKFVDRTFNCHRERAREIFRFLIEEIGRDGKTSFHFEIGASLLDEVTLDLLETAPVGLFEFEIGIQSTNPRTLQYVKRKNDWSVLAPVVQRLTKNQNIHLHLDLIAGLPEESYQSFRQSFNLVYALQPHLLQLGFLKLLKGSGLRARTDSFGCVFSDQPPYEVLSTDVLSFDEILQLRAIEDIVEKYYNSHRFQYSLRFLLACTSLTPFDLFQSMALYWVKRGLHRQSHSTNSLFEIFHQYVVASGTLCFLNKELFSIFLELLKFDYLLQSRGVQPLTWFPRRFLKNQKQRVHAFLGSEEKITRLLPHFRGRSAREINKKVHIEVFDVDVIKLINWLENNQLNEFSVNQSGAFLPILRQTTVLFDYSSLVGLLKRPFCCMIEL